MERALFVIQRLTALVLALLVLVHLGTIFYASHGGLTSAEILDRTRGHGGWAVYYAIFVAAAALHAPIGMRNVLNELSRLSRRTVDVVAGVFFLVLLATGWRAVYGVFGP